MYHSKQCVKVLPPVDFYWLLDFFFFFYFFWGGGGGYILTKNLLNHVSSHILMSNCNFFLPENGCE